MEARASLNYVRVSPRKTRQVVDLIRGKSVNEALVILGHASKKPARKLEKLIKSAVANVQQREDAVDVDELWIAEAFVDGGPAWKRWRPRARGRATRILKRTSHITVVLRPGA
ncbi:MAG: 50S ribosomal protein L22 [bacterium]|nr:50S ribosomal protein L22 [bacterium]MDV2502645.1 50S ribosomal protein L22 [bacterium]